MLQGAKYLYFYNFYLKNIVIYFSILFSNQAVCEDLSVTFFNIGQGNCVVSNCPSGNSLIVDCGSSEKNNPGIYRATIDINNVRDRIRKLAIGKPVTVFITHLDKDHYNLLPEIFDDDESELKSKISEVIIAGLWKEGQLILDREPPKGVSDLLKFNNWLYKLKKIKIPINFVNDQNYKSFFTTMCGREYPKILITNVFSSKKYTSREKSHISNGNGAILKISHGKCSTILTGDATKETTEEVIFTSLEELIKKIEHKVSSPITLLRNYIDLNPDSFSLNNIRTILGVRSSTSNMSAAAPVNVSKLTPAKTPASEEDEEDMLVIPDSKADYKTTVLMAAHHGATSHGSNSRKWIYSAQPQIVVVSAGDYGRYNHPRRDAYLNFIDTSYSKFLLADTENHNVSYFSGNTRSIVQNTNLGIFNTYNSGNIIVKFGLKNDSVGSLTDHYTVKSDIGGGASTVLVTETSCFSLSGVPSSPTRSSLMSKGTVSPGHGISSSHVKVLLSPIPFTLSGAGDGSDSDIDTD